MPFKKRAAYGRSNLTPLGDMSFQAHSLILALFGCIFASFRSLKAVGGVRGERNHVWLILKISISLNHCLLQNIKIWFCAKLITISHCLLQNVKIWFCKMLEKVWEFQWNQGIFIWKQQLDGKVSKFRYILKV